MILKGRALKKWLAPMLVWLAPVWRRLRVAYAAVLLFLVVFMIGPLLILLMLAVYAGIIYLLVRL